MDVAVPLGLTTRRYQSGEVDYDGHISRRGDSHVWSLLYGAAVVILTRSHADSDLRTWGIRGDGLSKKARAAIVAPILPIRTPSQFPSLQPDAELAHHPNLAAALGVIAFVGPQGKGFQKGGHNESTGNTLICLEKGKRCVLILSNDVRSEQIFPKLVSTVLGETGFPWSWEYISKD